MVRLRYGYGLDGDRVLYHLRTCVRDVAGVCASSSSHSESSYVRDMRSRTRQGGFSVTYIRKRPAMVEITLSTREQRIIFWENSTFFLAAVVCMDAFLCR